MKRTLVLITAALLGIAFTPQAAQAAQNCVNVPRTSYFGTITSVQPASFTLSKSSADNVTVYTHGSDIKYDGLQLRPGVYAGVYGCRWASRDGVIAEFITLSTSPATYPGNTPGNRYTSGDRVIEGRIDAVRPGRVLIDSNGGHGNTWVDTHVSGLLTGQLIRATGHFTSYDRDFVATSIVVLRQ